MILNNSDITNSVDDEVKSVQMSCQANKIEKHRDSVVHAELLAKFHVFLILLQFDDVGRSFALFLLKNVAFEHDDGWFRPDVPAVQESADESSQKCLHHTVLFTIYKIPWCNKTAEQGMIHRMQRRSKGKDDFERCQTYGEVGSWT